MTEFNTKLIELGFQVNTKIINGFRPHYIRENKDILFLIGQDYWLSKIIKISEAYKNYDGKVLGYLMPDAPNHSAIDWVFTKTLLLVNDKFQIGVLTFDFHIEFTDVIIF